MGDVAASHFDHLRQGGNSLLVVIQEVCDEGLISRKQIKYLLGYMSGTVSGTNTHPHRNREATHKERGNTLIQTHTHTQISNTHTHIQEQGGNIHTHIHTHTHTHTKEQ